MATDFSDPTGDLPAKLYDLEAVFGNIVSVLISAAGIALFIMLLVGGFKYMSAGSDPKAAEAAKKTLTYAIAGLVLIALSYLIITFIETFTGVSVSDFRVYQP